MKNYILLIIAIVLDLIIGDPVTPIHPVRLIGNLILKIETLLYNSNLSKKNRATRALIEISVLVKSDFASRE